jgi:hypothetical protein
MFDANLCAAPEGSKVWVKFTGSPSKFGDKTNIIAGTYKCMVLRVEGIGEELTLVVYNANFRNSFIKKATFVHYSDVGNRWVTYEGHV